MDELTERIIEQYGRERKAYQALFEAVDNNHYQVKEVFPDIFNAYSELTGVDEPDADILELLEPDNG